MALVRRRNAEDCCEDAMRLLQAKYYPAALAAADKAIAIAPEHAKARQLRGRALSELGRHEEALDACRQAVKLDPAMACAHYQAAVELHHLDRYAGALEAADTAIALDPDDTATFIVRA